MGFQFCTHSWEVRDIDDGTLVLLSSRDLDLDTVSVLVDDLLALVHDNGQPNLYLDFSNVRVIPSMVAGKLIAVNERLREHGGRVIVLGLNPVHYQMFQATRLTDVLDVRADQPDA